MTEATRKVAMVTGAGSGIGRSICTLLAKRGFRLVLAGRTEQKLAETGGLLGGSRGEDWEVIAADVGVAEQACAVVDQAIEAFGRLDALVNNAGWTELVPVADATPEYVRRVFEVNAMGPTWACARALPTMAAQSGGVIVNVSTVGTRDPFPGLGVYGAAKASIETLARAIANEHTKDGIRAYAIGPGAVETEMLRGLFGKDILPESQTLVPQDIARAVADCVTGQTDMASGETRYITP